MYEAKERMKRFNKAEIHLKPIKAMISESVSQGCFGRKTLNIISALSMIGPMYVITESNFAVDAMAEGSVIISDYCLHSNLISLDEQSVIFM